MFEFLRGLRFDVRRDLPVLGLALLTIILGLAGEAGRIALRYERFAIVDNAEWWRLLTGHFVHLGWPHLFLNLGGCTLVWLLFRKDYGQWQWLIILLASVMAMDVGFLWLKPSLDWYVGLSGLLHGLFAAGLISWLREGGWEPAVMLAIFGAKIVWEQYAGPLPFTAESAGGPVVVDAHMYGAIGGALAALLLAAIKKRGGYNSRPVV